MVEAILRSTEARLKKGRDDRFVVNRGRRGDRWNGPMGTEGGTSSGRKGGNQEKPKWVSSQVTWRRTGPNVQDGDTLSYSSSGRSWPLQVLSIHSGNASRYHRENEMRSISLCRYPSREKKEPSKSLEYKCNEGRTVS